DVRHQHHRDQPDQPRPDLDRDPRLAPRLQERLAGIVEGTAARQLGHLTEARLVHPQVAELLGVRYHQSRKLRANYAIVAPLGHADEVDTLLRRGEAPAIAAGRDLLEVDHRALPVRGNDSDLRVEEVDELALAVDGVHHDLADVVVPLD